MNMMKTYAWSRAQQYNGWSNRETWVVNLWLTNEPYIYTSLMKIMKEFKTPIKRAEELERMVRDDFESHEEEPCLWKDLLATALDCVNWREIVEGNQED
jgi:hypothetical protein